MDIQILDKGFSIIFTADFILRNNEGEKAVGWHIQVLKENDCLPTILYPVKLSFQNETKNKTFPYKKKKTEKLITTRSAPQLI